MPKRQPGDLDIGVPVTDRALDVVVVSVVAEVLAEVSGRAQEEVAAFGEVAGGVALILHGEDGSIPV